MGGHVSECEATSSQGHLPEWPIGCGSGMFNRKPFFGIFLRMFLPKWPIGCGLGMFNRKLFLEEIKILNLRFAWIFEIKRIAQKWRWGGEFD